MMSLDAHGWPRRKAASGIMCATFTWRVLAVFHNHDAIRSLGILHTDCHGSHLTDEKLEALRTAEVPRAQSGKLIPSALTLYTLSVLQDIFHFHQGWMAHLEQVGTGGEPPLINNR
jgi:hypothetical protein